ncbi:hypothetical protein FSP39_019680, partial [Pinctada imbricata]
IQSASFKYLYLVALSIGCFVCTSMNHRNKDCEDTFNNTGKFYKSSCWAPRSGRSGLFPATQCIKMIADDEARNFSLIVRDCVVDNGEANSETEIGRMSHCGWMKVIKYNNIRRRGCILSCQSDGCNTGSKQVAINSSVLWTISITLSLLYSKFNRIIAV